MLTFHANILENGEVILNYNGDIPTTFNVSYNTIRDIINFFNVEGYDIFQEAFNGNITLNLYPTADVSIDDYEKIYLEGHQLIFNKENINLHTTK